MINCIRDYILENGSVHVCGLGTLELLYREAVIHPICQDFTPPGKYLSFHADENEKGEKFSDYVAKKTGVNPEEARQMIVRWVSDVNAALQSDGAYVLGSMGRFVRGNVGLDFEPALDPELSADSFGLNAFSLREERTTLFEQKETTTPQAAVETVAERQEEAENKTVETQTSAPAVEEPATEETEETKDEEKAAAEIASPEETDNEVNQPEKPKKHVGKIIFFTLLILLLCAIIAAGVYALLRPDDYVQKKDYCISRIVSVFRPDTVGVDEVVSEEPVEDDWLDEDDGRYVEEAPAGEMSEETPAEAAPAAVGQTANCYVIIGGFGNAANADNLVRSLKAKFPNACNLGLNEKGTLTMVGVGPYTRAEAESKSKELSATYKDCWIFEK